MRKRKAEKLVRLGRARHPAAAQRRGARPDRREARDEPPDAGARETLFGAILTLNKNHLPRQARDKQEQTLVEMKAFFAGACKKSCQWPLPCNRHAERSRLHGGLGPLLPRERQAL